MASAQGRSQPVSGQGLEGGQAGLEGPLGEGEGGQFLPIGVTVIFTPIV
jgi:hypothetical protein